MIKIEKTQKWFFSAKKKSIMQQVMKPKDWVELAILIIVFVICWTLVWRAYRQPFDYDNLVEQSATNQK